MPGRAVREINHDKDGSEAKKDVEGGGGKVGVTAGYNERKK
jgi:hypothetical protein